MSIFDERQQEPPKQIRLRLRTAEDLEKFGRRCLRELYLGELPAARAKALTALLDAQRRLIEFGSMERKLSEVEQRLGGGAPSIVTEDDRRALRERIAGQMRQVESAAAKEDEDRDHAERI